MNSISWKSYWNKTKKNWLSKTEKCFKTTTIILSCQIIFPLISSDDEKQLFPFLVIIIIVVVYHYQFIHLHFISYSFSIFFHHLKDYYYLKIIIIIIIIMAFWIINDSDKISNLFWQHLNVYCLFFLYQTSFICWK